MSVDGNETRGRGLIATVGTFDGVHVGHLHLLGELKCHAGRLGLEPVAIVLDTHPLQIVRPEGAPPQLSTFDERRTAIESEGVRVVPLRFTAESRTATSEEFMRRIHDEMGIKALLVGHDNRFGSDRWNGLEHYRSCGAKIGLEVIEGSCLPGVSSSAVRKLLAAGNVEEGNRLLGHPYELDGIVVDGAKLGRRLGFPTANLRPTHAEMLVPGPGVYATCVSADGMGHFMPAMTNIGHRPTVTEGPSTLSIETHILDFDGDIYGKRMRILFLKRLRDEIRFDSLEALVAQLHHDADEARARLGASIGIEQTETTNRQYKK